MIDEDGAGGAAPTGTPSPSTTVPTTTTLADDDIDTPPLSYLR
jgi:hypothetical protein